MTATPTAATPTPEELAARDFYQKPEHGWTCFHCGETFTTIGLARDHFGFDPSAEPGCRIKVGAERGLLMALRKAEKECADAWFAIHNETTDAAKAYYAASARHQEQLRTAEEAGYERGLRDGGEAQRAEIERLTAALKKIDDVRNSIVAFQKVNFSEHVYPLVAALDEAGFEGMGYPAAVKYYGSMMDRTNAAEARATTAEAALSASQERERVMREALTGLCAAMPSGDNLRHHHAKDEIMAARAALAKETADER